MTAINELDDLINPLTEIVNDCIGRRVDYKAMSKQLTEFMTIHNPKWNWTVLCGDQYAISTDGQKGRDIMLNRTFEHVRVVILRGSPLEQYISGSPNLCVVRNKLPKPDTDAIKTAIEYSSGNIAQMCEFIRKYLKEHYPTENWIVIAGDDFAVTQDDEQMPSLVYCATVGRISIVVVQAENSCW